MAWNFDQADPSSSASRASVFALALASRAGKFKRCAGKGNRACPQVGQALRAAAAGRAGHPMLQARGRSRGRRAGCRRSIQTWSAGRTPATSSCARSMLRHRAGFSALRSAQTASRARHGLRPQRSSWTGRTRSAGLRRRYRGPVRCGSDTSSAGLSCTAPPQARHPPSASTTRRISDIADRRGERFHRVGRSGRRRDGP